MKGKACWKINLVIAAFIFCIDKVSAGSNSVGHTRNGTDTAHGTGTAHDMLNGTAQNETSHQTHHENGTHHKNDTHRKNGTHHSNHTHRHNHTHGTHKGIHVFVEMFDNVSTPFIVCCWIMLASIAKVAFHHFENLSAAIPESCLLILLGVPVGFILEEASVTGHLFLTSNLFFQYLLPPIIFDAGYFINSGCFFNNIGTILLYAIVGTIFNTFAVGICMYGVAGVCGVTISLLHSFLFGALISAVDPVAVLTVFEEVQVNELLYMLVFGESVLNDAASVVLYRTFENLPEDNVDGRQVGLAIASFLVVSIFGTIIGIIYGLVASFMTKFTDHVRVIEPIFVFILAYMSYLTAEIFHFSGIMSILFCGVVMKPYVESNVSRKSHITIKYFLKLLSSSCEAVIFMFLGIALVQYQHSFNIKFVIFTILFISIFRALGIVSLTGLANRFGRLDQVSRVEQFIMSYGGLRGAVAFCLVIVLDEGVTEESKLLKKLLVTTTLAVIIFTCFVQGGSIKMMVEKFNVDRAESREPTMTEHLNDKVMSHMVAGVEEILGIHGHGYWRNFFQMFNRYYLRPCLERNPEMALDDNLFAQQRRIDHKVSIHAATTEGDENSEVINEEGLMRRKLSNDSLASSVSGYSHMGYQPTPGYTPGYQRNMPLPSNPGYTNPGYTDSGTPPPEFYQPDPVANPNVFFAPPSNTVTLTQLSQKANFSAKDFAYVIPHAKKIKNRKRYSDAAVGLHQTEWEEIHHAKEMRDTFGKIIPIELKKHHRHHHGHHHQGHHGHHGRHRGHHQEGQHHGGSHHHGGPHRNNPKKKYRSQAPDHDTITEDEEAEEVRTSRRSSRSGKRRESRGHRRSEEMSSRKGSRANTPNVDKQMPLWMETAMDDEKVDDVVINIEMSEDKEDQDVTDYVPRLPTSNDSETSLYRDVPVADLNDRTLSQKVVDDMIDHSLQKVRTSSSSSSNSSSSSSSGETIQSEQSSIVDVAPSALEVNSPWGAGRGPEDESDVAVIDDSALIQVLD